MRRERHIHCGKNGPSNSVSLAITTPVRCTTIPALTYINWRLQYGSVPAQGAIRPEKPHIWTCDLARRVMGCANSGFPSL